MDLLVYLTIAVVFLVSFISLAFIHSRFRTGKTFDEVQAEKKLLADKLFGIKPKKVNRKITKKGNTKERKIKERKEQEVDSQNDSDAQSGSVSAGSNNSPTHSGHANKAHVDFSEAEIISDDSVSIKKSLGGKRNTNTTQRKNSGIKFNRTSILLNKSETLPVETSNEATKTLNHFEESHPKGDVEMKRQKEENMPKKDVRKGKYKRDINSSPKIEKPLPSQGVVSNNAALPIIPTVNGMLSVDASTINSFSTIAEMEIDTEQLIQKESLRNVATVNKEKINKKKKNEMISMQALPIMNPEDITVNGMIALFGKAELTRSEIQILIDYLLNKQQDTISVNHSDWSDDIVQKLKKQLMDKEKELQASIEQSISIQAKLKEIRATYNEERIQNHQKTISFSDEIGRYKAEITVLQQEIQFLNEKLLNESQLRIQQVQVLQGKLSQAKQANDTASDNIHKIQQLTDANQTLTNENVSKTQRINELNQFIQDKHQINEEIREQLDSCNIKLNELEVIRNKNDETRNYLENEMTKIKQHLNDTEHELTILHSENNSLHDDVIKLKDENETLRVTHEYEKGQLKEQLATAEQNKSNHLDDASKVEIRNLQNALDSSKKLMTICNDDLSEQKLQNDILTAKVNEMQSLITSLGVCNNKQSNQIKDLTAEAKNFDILLAEKSSTITDYEKQLQNQNNKEDELFKQIADHREKNNDLRTKNWKLIEALRTTENNANKYNQNNLVINLDKIRIDEQIRTKQLLERLLPHIPSGPSDYHDWIEHVEQYLKQHMLDNDNNNINNNNSTNNYINNNNNNSSNNNNNNIDNNNIDNNNINNNNINNNNNKINNNNDNNNNNQEEQNSANNISDSSTTSTSSSTNHYETNNYNYNELILENERLRKAAEECKNIVADTGNLLRNLENTVKEQNVEIQTLKSATTTT